MIEFSTWRTKTRCFTFYKLLLLVVLAAVMICGTAPAQTQSHTSWQEYLGGPDASHYSALTQIDRSNVNQLQIAWTYNTGDGVAYDFNPLIVGKVMYVLAKNYSVVALDASTGKELWDYRDPETPARGELHGISFWESKEGKQQRLLFPVGYYLEEIDARTGTLIFSFGDHGKVDLRMGLGRDPKSIAHIASSSPGTIYGDLIIEGSSTGEDYGSPPGDIRAYNVLTGDLTWTFHMVPMDLPGMLRMSRQPPPSLFALPHNLPPAQEGRAVYQEFCQRCHGPDRQGMPPSIPSLVDAPAQLGPSVISSVVQNGLGSMPAFSDLTGTLLDNLITYLTHPEDAPAQVTLLRGDDNKASSPYPSTAQKAPNVFYYTPYGLMPEPIKPPWSTVTAFDLNSGTILWQVPFGKAPQAPDVPASSIMEPRNGIAVTGGGLIFAATLDEGKLRAYDQKTGEVLWSTDLPSASEGVPSVYEVNGREYLVLPVCTIKGTDLPRDRSAISQPLTHPVQRNYIAFTLPVDQSQAR